MDALEAWSPLSRQQKGVIVVCSCTLLYVHVLAGGVMFPMSPQSKCPPAKGISVDDRKTLADLLLANIILANHHLAFLDLCTSVSRAASCSAAAQPW
jgi:hypothetical protein